MAEHEGSSGLFGVFILSIYSLFLIPYTFYYLCSSDEDVTQPYEPKGKRKQSFAQRAAKRLFTKGNLVLLLLWAVFMLLVFYVQWSAKSMKPFDPYEILGLEPGADDRDIKKAYRKLSLQYHPDKNPDPSSQHYFAEYISKAYAALTDEVSRQNYEKYGHPDGPQGMNIGVALPEWMFNKDSKTAPLLLLGLVGFGILLPLSLISWHMLSSSKFSGPNNIMNDTMMYFLHSKYCVKESQSLVRIPETLMCAMEFITLYTPDDHKGPCEELRKMVGPLYPELMAKDKKAFWTRKASLIKCHMLLLAHLERLANDVPAVLQPDLKYVLQKSPILLEEIIKIALLPRPPTGLGWMTPAVAAVEMMQCILQAVDINSRKGQGKAGDSAAPLLQLPHFGQEALKKLRKRKVNSLKDLMELDETARADVLAHIGLSDAQAEEVNTALSALPAVAVRVACEVDGEDEIMEQDPVHCRARILLSRPSHKTEGYTVRGKAARAYLPHYPLPRDETWWFFLVDAANNAVLAFHKASLLDAEKASVAHPDAFSSYEAASSGQPGGSRVEAGGKALLVHSSSSGNVAGGKQLVVEEESSEDGKAPVEEFGQEIDLMFQAPKAGRLDLQLLVMCESYIGCDRTIPVKLKVAPLTRAVAEGRDAKSKAAAKQWVDSDDEDEGACKRARAVRPVGDDADSASGSDDEDEDDDGEDYDSEETGEEESDDGEHDKDA